MTKKTIAHKAPKLPDFIIIGAMKSATTTLYEQLSMQPGIFMCHPKEPGFFSADNKFAKGMDWYQALFAGASEGSLIGEASTDYTKLPSNPYVVVRLKQYLPDARFIYLMRHPVDRLVSHYMHDWSMGGYGCTIQAAIQHHPKLIAYSLYSLQLEPYFETFGRDRVLPVFFDRLVREPQAELERICKFIGHQGEVCWRHDLKPSNISLERIRRIPIFDLIVYNKFSTRLRRALIPQGFRDRVKSQLMMKQRPELSAETRAELEVIFNKDLNKVGSWLGVSLNCENFNEITGKGKMNWIGLND